MKALISAIQLNGVTMNINDFSEQDLIRELTKNNPQLQELLALKERLTEEANKIGKPPLSKQRTQNTINHAAEEKLVTIAFALGACPACWGSDQDCEECHGDGECGSFLPDMDYFEVYVRPVLNLLLEQEMLKRQQRVMSHPQYSSMRQMTD